MCVSLWRQDNVGDNVGDVAGMGADLFESYVGSIIAACTLAVSQSQLPGNVMTGKGAEGVALAFMLPAVGIICSIVGYFAVNTDQEGKGWNVQLGSLMWALEKGMYLGDRSQIQSLPPPARQAPAAASELVSEG